MVLSPFDLECHLAWGLLPSFCLHDHSFDEHGMVELCAFTVLRSFVASPHSSVRVMKLDTPTFSAYAFIIVMFSSWATPLANMNDF